EADRERVWSVVDRFLTRVGEVRLTTIPGMEEVSRDLLEDAVAMQEELIRDRDSPDPATRHEVARAYLRVVRIRRLLQETDRDLRACEKAVALLGPLASEYPDRMGYRRA